MPTFIYIHKQFLFRQPGLLYAFDEISNKFDFNSFPQNSYYNLSKMLICQSFNSEKPLIYSFIVLPTFKTRVSQIFGIRKLAIAEWTLQSFDYLSVMTPVLHILSWIIAFYCGKNKTYLRAGVLSLFYSDIPKKQFWLHLHTFHNQEQTLSCSLPAYEYIVLEA